MGAVFAWAGGAIGSIAVFFLSFIVWVSITEMRNAVSCIGVVLIALIMSVGGMVMFWICIGMVIRAIVLL